MVARPVDVACARAPGGRRRRRALLRAGGARLRPGELRRRGALRPAPRPVGERCRTWRSRAAASQRRSVDGAHRRVRRRGVRRHDPARSSSTTRPSAAGARCRRCARRGTGWAGFREEIAYTRSRVARRRASTSRTRSSSSTYPDARLIPLKDNIPTVNFPVVTVALIVLNVGMYFFFQQGGLLAGRAERRALQRERRRSTARSRTRSRTRATSASRRASGRRAALTRDVDLAPTWLTLLTSMFMHGGLLHLGGNMLFLWIFGNNIEDSMGRLKFIAFYLARRAGRPPSRRP